MDLSTKISKLQSLFSACEPEICAFVPEDGRFDRLRQEAAALEETYPDPARRPPLFGVFLGVKDIFQVDGFPTRAGSRLPPDVLAGPEGDTVGRLKAAGALVVGKTITTEFAYFAPGPTRNPHNPDHTPGGSSSGSAAAVAAGLCEIALGTQTIGSVNRPAAFCGVIGFKPSYDRISREGVIPLAPSVDHVGLFAATFELLEKASASAIPDWTPVSRLPSPILGIPEGPYLEQAEPEGLAHFRALVPRLSSAGFEIKSVPAMPDFEEIVQRHNALVAAEAARVHEKWFAEFGQLYHPKTKELIERGQSISDLQSLLESRSQLRAHLTDLMETHRIDLWLAPSAPGPAPRGLESTGNPVMNLPWTHAGLPTLTLPAGKNEEGLPLGVQLVGGWYEDEKLLKWGKNFQSLISNHRAWRLENGD